jgi:EAL domain-containing protein (putative c-di-GMP-specific phosphodiesterase class I)
MGLDAQLLIIQMQSPCIVDAVKALAVHKKISVTLLNDLSSVTQEIERKMLSGIPTDKPLIDLSLEHSVHIEHVSANGCLEQIVSYYQPQISVDSGRVYGAEVLARWNYKEHFVLGPLDIFTVLKTSRQREALWQIMLRNAATTLHRLQGSALNPAVNVCADVASSVDWSEHLADFFRRSALAPQQLTVEITESHSQRSELSLAGAVAQLRRHGFHCAIDDFGTGFSSIERLATTPFNKLKIDRGFIHRARSSVAGSKLLQSTVALAHNLGLIVIAEGIETKEDYERICELGVDIAQGWYFAAPMPLESFVNYIKSHRDVAEQRREAD